MTIHDNRLLKCCEYGPQVYELLHKETDEILGGKVACDFCQIDWDDPRLFVAINEWNTMLESLELEAREY